MLSLFGLRSENVTPAIHELDSLTGTGMRAALVSLVDQPGIGPEAVADKYVYLTAGACGARADAGPCRP